MRLKGAKHKLLNISTQGEPSLGNHTTVRTYLNDYNDMLIWLVKHTKGKVEYSIDMNDIRPLEVGPHTYGIPIDKHYDAKFDLWFENLQDAVSFKLRWEIDNNKNE